MSNRYMNQFPLTFEKQVKTVFARVAIGASGAPTLSAADSKGVLSVTRNSAGLYTIVFGASSQALDTYKKLLSVHAVFNSGSSAPASPELNIAANNIATAGTASIQVGFRSGGTLTDPANGEILYMTFMFGDSGAV